MTVRRIITVPDPILRKKSESVNDIDKDIKKLMNDMLETMYDAPGIGLAANQIGQLWRIIVLQMPEEESSRIYFNPEIIKTEGTREVEEGCLSIPNYRGLVNRSVSIKFQGKDYSDNIVTFKAENLLSQAVEHEVDHLNGILYTDHLVAHSELYRVEEPDTSHTNEDSSNDDYLNSSSTIELK